MRTTNIIRVIPCEFIKEHLQIKYKVSSVVSVQLRTITVQLYNICHYISITYGSEGDVTDYQPEENNINRAEVDIIFQGLIICTVTLTAMCYLFFYTDQNCNM